MPQKFIVCQFPNYSIAYPIDKVAAGNYLERWHVVKANNNSVASRFAKVKSLDQCDKVKTKCIHHDEGFDSLEKYVKSKGFSISQLWRADIQKEIDAENEKPSTITINVPGQDPITIPLQSQSTVPDQEHPLESPE